MTSHFRFFESLGEFVVVSIGGVGVGLLLGFLVFRLIAPVDDYLIQTTLTTLLAFGSYLVAERLHFSGVLAVVAAGLLNGNLGTPGISPTSRIVINNFWEYVAFLANSLLFLLIGLEVNLPALVAAWQPVIWSIGAVLLARWIVIYGLSGLLHQLIDRIPLSWLHVLNWGGLRGAIAFALVLSLPAGFDGNRELMRLMVFGVVLFTLLVQSTTMQPLLLKLGFSSRLPEHVEHEKKHARLTAARTALNHLEHRHAEGLISPPIWESIRIQLNHQIAAYAADVRETLDSAPDIEAEELDTVLREALRVQRSAVIGLHHDGIISDDKLSRLSLEIDAALSAEEADLYKQLFGVNLSPKEKQAVRYKHRSRSVRAYKKDDSLIEC